MKLHKQSEPNSFSWKKKERIGCLFSMKYGIRNRKASTIKELSKLSRDNGGTFHDKGRIAACRAALQVVLYLRATGDLDICTDICWISSPLVTREIFNVRYAVTRNLIRLEAFLPVVQKDITPPRIVNRTC